MGLFDKIFGGGGNEMMKKAGDAANMMLQSAFLRSNR